MGERQTGQTRKQRREQTKRQKHRRRLKKSIVTGWLCLLGGMVAGGAFVVQTQRMARVNQVAPAPAAGSGVAGAAGSNAADVGSQVGNDVANDVGTGTATGGPAANGTAGEKTATVGHTATFKTTVADKGPSGSGSSSGGNSASGSGASGSGASGSGASGSGADAGGAETEQLSQAVDSYLKTRSDTVGIAVLNQETGALFTYNGSQAFDTASTVKVSILIDALEQGLVDPTDKRLETAMVEESDNQDATKLYDEIGGNAALDKLFRQVGMDHTKPGDPGYWGLTQTTAADEVKLLAFLVDGSGGQARAHAGSRQAGRGVSALTPADRQLALKWMEDVTPHQQWGVNSGVSDATIALKNGWSPATKDNWRVNSMGWIDGNGRDYLIAVYTFNNPTMAYGVQTIDQLSRLVWGEEKPEAGEAASGAGAR